MSKCFFPSLPSFSGRHSGHSTPREECSSSATSPSSQSSASPGPKSFYPRQGAQSKYLIGWRKPGSTINSVDFGDTRKYAKTKQNKTKKISLELLILQIHLSDSSCSSSQTCNIKLIFLVFVLSRVKNIQRSLQGVSSNTV